MGRGAYLGGIAAEEIALRVYRAEGAELVAMRWRCPEGEIDLILRQDGLLIFVEVKARRDRDAAAHALTPRQRRRLGSAAQRYLAEHAAPAQACRFDVVLVDRAGRAERLENALGFDDW